MSVLSLATTAFATTAGASKTSYAQPASSATIRKSIQGGEVVSEKELDMQLVERTRKGDNRAFDLLVKKYQHKILALVGRMLKDRDEVQDVTQEAFIKAYRALDKFRGDSAFYTWLYRIAINTAKNYLVASSRRPSASNIDIEDAEIYSEDDHIKDIATPENLAMREQLQQTIDTAISALPDDLRTALTLREFEGLSYEEISQVMDCPVGTVRSRIFRARESVDARIKPLLV